MTMGQFMGALWLATVAYVAGDRLWCAGDARDSGARRRAGCLLIAAAWAALAALGVVLVQMAI